VAAISNDPPGNLNPDGADVINGAQPRGRRDGLTGPATSASPIRQRMDGEPGEPRRWPKVRI
jgi:hypothetical protein